VQKPHAPCRISQVEITEAPCAYKSIMDGCKLLGRVAAGQLHSIVLSMAEDGTSEFLTSRWSKAERGSIK
jgi:hypothetical protein